MGEGQRRHLLSFPPYRSQAWIEENKSLPAVEECLSGVSIQPKGMLRYAHVKAYESKANSVRREIRNSLFRQALFKIQNIEVLTYKDCRKDRVLMDIRKNQNPWKLPDFVTNRTGRALLSEEFWTVDRCGVPQKYRVRFSTEGPDGFNCKVFVTSLTNLVNYVKYYLSM